MNISAYSPEHGDAHVVERSFAELTTLRIGGDPAAVIRCTSPEALAAEVARLDAAGIPLLVVGGGSNLVIGEGAEVGELVVVWAEQGSDSLNIVEGGTPGQTVVVRAFAGEVWDDFVERTVAAGLGGLECLSGIPGSVGATPVQNVGAYGADVAQTLWRVQLYDRRTREVSWVSPDSLDLAYRYSNLKFTNRAVVLAVEFQLTTDGLSVPLRYGELARRLDTADKAKRPGMDEGKSHDRALKQAQQNPPAELRFPVADVRQAVLELRRGKGMVLDAADHDTWSAGSFFTNPIVVGKQRRDEVLALVRQKVGEEALATMPLFEVDPPADIHGDIDGAARAQGGVGLGGDGRGEPGAQPGAAAAAAGGAERGYKFSAAWLIERAGFHKGWHVPGNERASLSTKHTLALTNRGTATSADIVELARAVRDGVREAFGITLQPEPIWIGVSLN